MSLVQNVTNDDEDVYHCYASNKFGRAGFSSNLVVRSKSRSFVAKLLAAAAVSLLKSIGLP